MVAGSARPPIANAFLGDGVLRSVGSAIKSRINLVRIYAKLRAVVNSC